MLIRTKFTLAISVILLASAALILTVYWSSDAVARTVRAEHNIVQSAGKLTKMLVLAQEYVLLPNERIARQWQQANITVTVLLNQGRGVAKDKHAGTLVNIEKRLAKIDRLMRRLIRSQQSNALASKNKDVLQRMQIAIGGRLREEISLALGETIDLAEHYQQHIAEIYVTTRTLVTSIVLSFVLAMLVILAWIRHALFVPIQGLVRETRMIAGGNFKNRLNNPSTDEIGELSRSFNSMAEQLQTTMISRDVLEFQVKERTIALQQASDVAIKANNAKSEFLSRMSHELRTPLNAVLGFTQLLQLNGRLVDADRDSVVEIHKAGEHLLYLVNEILDTSSLDAGTIQVDITDVDLKDVVNECVMLLSSVTVSCKVALVDDVEAGLMVRADRVRLKQVMINIISNAIKYNKAGGRVRIFQMVDKDKYLQLCVEDTGMGIKQEDFGKVFVAFERFAGPAHVVGTGIGLSIAKRLMQLMDGDVNFISEYGKGSTFKISIPVATGQAR